MLAPGVLGGRIRLGKVAALANLESLWAPASCAAGRIPGPRASLALLEQENPLAARTVR